MYLHTYTQTHTYNPLIHHSSVNGWIWNMSGTIVHSKQGGQRNILNKSIYKVYVRETM
jgi:hypothetical protein